jgi:AefR-like transcriptional repressor, C-terminal domain
MVSDLSGELIEDLDGHTTNRTVRDVLIEFGTRLVSSYSVSHLTALYRIALSKATRDSGIGREFFKRGPGKLTMCLAQYLDCSVRRFNQLRIDNSRRVADNFVSLLLDNLKLSNAMTAPRTSSVKDHRSAVTEAVELLCHGIVAGGQ